MEKELTVDEIFCAMPLLKEYFKDLERNLRRFRRRKDMPYCTKELLERKKEELLQTAKSLTRVELKIIYYLRALSCVNEWRFFQILQDVYKSECILKNVEKGENIYFDILNICKP